MKVVIVMLSAAVLVLSFAVYGVASRDADDSVIGGATAICEDGMLSMSRSSRGTCSHHGGVEVWINEP
jgi:hypothetical protein